MKGNLIYLILFAFLCNMILNQSCGIKSGSNCFGASTPVDLILQNPIDRKLEIILLEFSDTKSYEIIDRLTMKPKQDVTICLEYEGPISNGLYIYSNGILSKLILSTTNLNRFDIVNDLRFRIEMSDDIKKLLN